MNKWFVYLVILHILFFQNVYEPHRWCNDYCACLECGRSKIRASISSNYKIGICCFSANHTALRRKSKDWFARNQDNVSECDNMSIHGLLFQWANYKNPTMSVGLVQSEPHQHNLIENYITDIAEKLLSWHLAIITYSLKVLLYYLFTFVS